MSSLWKNLGGAGAIHWHRGQLPVLRQEISFGGNVRCSGINAELLDVLFWDV